MVAGPSAKSRLQLLLVQVGCKLPLWRCQSDPLLVMIRPLQHSVLCLLRGWIFWVSSHFSSVLQWRLRLPICCYFPFITPSFIWSRCMMTVVTQSLAVFSTTSTRCRCIAYYHRWLVYTMLTCSVWIFITTISFIWLDITNSLIFLTHSAYILFVLLITWSYFIVCRMNQKEYNQLATKDNNITDME